MGASGKVDVTEMGEGDGKDLPSIFSTVWKKIASPPPTLWPLADHKLLSQHESSQDLLANGGLGMLAGEFWAL